MGATNVVGGSLSLAGAVSPTNGMDERALLWHVLVWDLWFVVWGAALTGAIFSYRRARPHNVPGGIGEGLVRHDDAG
jgi:hypothetical protein